MSNLPVHYIIRERGVTLDEGMNIVPGGLRGTSPSFMLLDECLLLRPETNLQPPTVNTINTVRTIVAKHLPENEPLPKRNWLQRWLINPEPDEQPEDLRIVGDSSPIYTNAEMKERFAMVETPYADSFMDELETTRLQLILEGRRKAEQGGVLTSMHHLEKHLESLSNETMTDTIARAVTRDCIEILRGVYNTLEDAESGGA